MNFEGLIRVDYSSNSYQETYLSRSFISFPRIVRAVDRSQSRRFTADDRKHLGELHIRQLANRLRISLEEAGTALVDLDRLHLRSEETVDLVRRYVRLAPEFRKIQWREALRASVVDQDSRSRRKGIDDVAGKDIETSLSGLADLLKVSQSTLQTLLSGEGNFSDELLRLDLPQLVILSRSADELERQNAQLTAHEEIERNLRLTSQRLLLNVKSARGEESRRKFAREHDRLQKKVHLQGFSQELRSQVAADGQQIEQIRRLSGSHGVLSPSPLGPVVDAVLGADLDSARELLGHLVLSPEAPEEPEYLVSDMLNEVLSDPSWAISLTLAEVQTWVDRAVTRHEQINRALSQWLLDGRYWMEPAEWPRAQQMQAGRFLLRGTIRWFDQSNFRWQGSEAALSHLLAAADEILPFADFAFLSREPAAVNIAGTRVVNWFREDYVYSWVGFSEGAVALTIDTKTFQVKRRQPSDAALAASMLAVAWLLDSISRSSGTKSAVFADDHHDEWLRADDPDSGRLPEGLAILEKHASNHIKAHVRTLPDGYRPTPEALQRAPEYLRAIMGRNQTYVRPSTRSSTMLFQNVQRFSAKGSFVSDVVYALKRAR